MRSLRSLGLVEVAFATSRTPEGGALFLGLGTPAQLRPRFGPGTVREREETGS
jgi:hypothetical protein